MNFEKHLDLEGCHAPFPASRASWLRYDDDKAVEVYFNRKAAEQGTIIHSWAKSTIDLGIKQPRSHKTLYSYVNDAIKYKMDTEVVLFYSDIFFGTADAISFIRNKLRIHDLKTGKTPAHMEQLEVYAALFCLEYDVNPNDISIELRIYQNDEIIVHEPEAEVITSIMNKIIHFDILLTSVEGGVNNG